MWSKLWVITRFLSRTASLGEQTVAQANGYPMTLLTAEILGEEDGRDEPQFRR